MITKAHITKRANDEHMEAQVVERDYVLAHAVSAIARYDTDCRLVFKGGTSLRLIHLEDYRYSADLDFSLQAGTREEAIALVDEAFRRRGDANPQLSLVTGDDNVRVKYLGPLGRERDLKLDLAIDELVVNVERAPIRGLWDDVPAAEVTVYTLLEVAGEKLRCILQRLQCRDFYDLYRLLCLEQVDPRDAVELFRRKAAHLHLDPSKFSVRYQEQMSRYKTRWLDELGDYMSNVPPFNEVERRVRQVLRQTNLL
ncbi:MAG: nucleotidyl transferase AbiEii/AbiGii toxin family protein [Chloroflexi bacterium]|nr:nucleotidyl transferase AbiEii/AbiGii toxin family protein [Chloroflexota bacterium]